MTLIKISNEYSIDMDKYVRLEAGDIIKSQSQLRKNICYPEITTATANNGTVKRLQPIIDKLINYERLHGNKIKILSTIPPHKVEEIVNSYLLSTKSQSPRIIYSPNRKYLLDYVINSYEREELYLTTSTIINQSVLFQPFFHEYQSLHFDINHANKDDVKKLNDFTVKHKIKDKYKLIDVMEKLNEILYGIFNTKNIASWAGSRYINHEKVLFQGGDELIGENADYIKQGYIKPLIDRNIPAKSIIKLANRNYMKDHEISYGEHEWFFYTNKFTLTSKFNVDVNDEEFEHHQSELSEKVLQKLNSDNHEIINKIKF
ncbi:MAG: hypothetical protein FWF81_14500 [Defluviitaleaceae bacterium]|nr:hypothetical protein [Defluviitaleaceae bacterium]